MVGTGGKEPEDIEVITDTDILAVSDSACVATAHTCAAHNLVAGKVKQLAATPSREVLLAKMLGSLKGPLTSLAIALNAIIEKKQQETA